MHPNAQKTQQAIDQIRMTRSMVSDLLADTPEFQTRSEHMLDTLANGLAFAIGGKVTSSNIIRSSALSAAQDEPSGARTIMGREVPATPAPMVERIADIQPAGSDVEKLRAEITKAYSVFTDMPNKEIRNTLSELEVRGVAKRAGLAYSQTDQPNITDKFITAIKDAIRTRAQEDARLADADETTADLKAGDQTTAPKPPAPPAANKTAE